MKKVLFITNVAVPFRVDFFNALGKYTDLTVIFEAKYAEFVKYNWDLSVIKKFKAIFLKEGRINEKKIDKSIFKYINGNYDSIIVSGYSSVTMKILIIYLKAKKINYYLEVDGGIIRRESFFKKLLKKILISGANGYFSPSTSVDEYLRYYGANSDKIYRYPFSSLLEKDILAKPISSSEKLKLKKELGLEEYNVVLSVGQFIHRKGMDILMRAFSNSKGSNFLCIVGGSPNEDYLKLVSELGIKDIRFVSYKSKEELIKYYSASDLFVLATREDIWGLVINEAMGLGLPIITTDHCVAGLELVRNDLNGFLVPVENIDELTKKMNYVLNDVEKRKIMGNESLKIIRDYTIENMARIHFEILQNNEF